MKQFDRQYRFSAGPAGGSGFEIGATTPEQPTAMHICFNIEKADTQTPNTAKISVWNLNPEHLAILNEKDCVVTLRAGYGSLTTLIFVGTITYIETMLDGADRETAMEAADGRVELRDTYVSLSYSGKISGKKIVDDVAGQMGITVSASYNAEFYDFPTGFSFIGPGSAALDKACASNDLQWQIQNGILQIKKKHDTMTREVFILSSESGLIGIPKKITFGKDSSDGAEQPGWEVEYLLNGAIGIGDYVRLESKQVSGYYRVHSIAMYGDNLEGDWLCAAKLIEA